MKKEKLNKLLREIKTVDIMHNKIIKLQKSNCINDAILYIIKYKIDNILVTSEDDIPVGIISKDDLLGAYYLGFSLDSAIEKIFSQCVISCTQNATLEEVLNIMASKKVLSLYVNDGFNIIGYISYPDIIGIMYRFCFTCPKNRFQNHNNGFYHRFITAKDVMNRNLMRFSLEEPVKKAVEAFLSNESSIILVEKKNKAYGVLTKTDILLAYRHKILLTEPVSLLTKNKIISCFEDDSLIKVLKIMIATDVENILVLGTSSDVKGFVSLASAAQLRSGSCKACKTSKDIELISGS